VGKSNKKTANSGRFTERNAQAARESAGDVLLAATGVCLRKSEVS